jgi:hypothetical protein
VDGAGDVEGTRLDALVRVQICLHLSPRSQTRQSEYRQLRKFLDMLGLDRADTSFFIDRAIFAAGGS